MGGVPDGRTGLREQFVGERRGEEYTAEIELRPTIGGSIGRKFDPETGTGFLNFNTER